MAGETQAMLNAEIEKLMEKNFKKMRSYRKVKSKVYKKGKQTLVFGLGAIPKEGIQEIKIRFNRSKKKFLGKVSNSMNAADFLRKVFPRGSIELQESFLVLYCNQNNEISGYYKHSIGAINATIADIRIIMATALLSASVAIVIAHNHPSGNVNPSKPDIELTRRIKSAAELLNIKLLDHLIITKEKYYSFADEGQL